MDEQEVNQINDLYRAFNTLSKTGQARFIRKFIRSLDAHQLCQTFSLVSTLIPLDPLSQLPVDVCLRILEKIDDVRTILHLSRVCKWWLGLGTGDSTLWRRLYSTRWMSIGARSLVENRLNHPLFSDHHRRLLQEDEPNLVRSYQQAFKYDHVLAKNWRLALCKSMSIECHGNHVITCLQVDDSVHDRIITGSDDALIKIWNGTTGKRVAALAGHQGGVWALKAVGNLLVSGSTDRSLIVWDLGTMTRKWDLIGHTSTVRCLEICNEFVVSGSRDGTVRVWHWPSGRMVYLLQGHTASVRCLTLWRDRYVISGSYDQTCRVWDLNTGECVSELSGHLNKVYSVVASNKYVYSGSMDATVRCWDPLTGQCISTITGHRSLVGIMQSRMGLLVSGSTDGSLRAWNTKRNEAMYRMNGAHPSSITTLDFNHVVLASGSENMVRFWDLRDGRLLANNVLNEDVDMVWRVVLTWRFCVIAYQSRGITRMEILDFEPGMVA